VVNWTMPGQRGRERWARLRRSLWQPPRPHGEQPRERTVGPLSRISAMVAVACLGVGAARPTPLILGLALVLSIHWVFAVARRLATPAE
jgi:hypothetical protein